MTDELEKLAPEVAHSVRCVDAEPFSDGAITHWPVVRAELLRLADENFRLQEANIGLYARMEHLERAEAELAALKARIARSWMCRVSNDTAHGEFGSAIYGLPSEFRGKLAWLLVED